MKRLAVIAVLVFILCACTTKEPYTVYYMPLEFTYYGIPAPQYFERLTTRLYINSENITEIYGKVDDIILKLRARPYYEQVARIKVIDSKSNVIWIMWDNEIVHDGFVYSVPKPLVKKAIIDIMYGLKSQSPTMWKEYSCNTSLYK